MQSRLLFVLIFLLANHWALAQAPSSKPAEKVAMREEARRLNAHLVYRLSPVSPVLSRSGRFTWITKIAIKEETPQPNKSSAYSGTISVQILPRRGAPFERSRALTETEMSDLAKIIYMQEVFLLPKLSAEGDDLGRFSYSGMDEAAFALERYDARTKTKSVVVRTLSESVPFEKVFLFIQNLATKLWHKDIAAWEKK